MPSTRSKGKRMKEKIVEAFGGKCQICGCVDYPEIYDIHHLNPKIKKESPSYFYTSNCRRLSNITFKKMLLELDKCILICSNCHRKLHKNHVKIKHIMTFNPKILIDEYCDKCPVCNGKKLKITQTCSVKCRCEFRRKVKRPDKNQLKKEIETTSYIELGKKYGVADNTIKNWAKQYYIYKPKLYRREGLG